MYVFEISSSLSSALPALYNLFPTPLTPAVAIITSIPKGVKAIWLDDEAGDLYLASTGNLFQAAKNSG